MVNQSFAYFYASTYIFKYKLNYFIQLQPLDLLVRAIPNRLVIYMILTLDEEIIAETILHLDFQSFYHVDW